jgi:hypothetical protein
MCIVEKGDRKVYPHFFYLMQQKITSIKWDICIKNRRIKMGLISGGLAAIGSIASAGIAAHQAKQKEKRALSDKTKNETWFSNERYKDALNTEENRALMKEIGERIQTNKEVAARAGDMLGLSSGEITEQQDAENRSYSEALGAMAQQGEQEKEAAVNTFINKNNDVASQLSQVEQQKGQAWGTAMQGVGQAAGSVAGYLAG